MLPSGEVKSFVADLSHLFATQQVLVARGSEVVRGVLRPDLHPEHPEVRAALETWEGTHFLRETSAGTEAMLVRRVAPAPPERWWLHALLFLLTLLTTTAAGAAFLGREAIEFSLVALGPASVPLPTRVIPADLLRGMVFSIPLVGILFGHEMGHYVVARRHRMDVSPPYFIPSPHWLNLIGTFGAFIRLRSPIVNRRVLLDVGAGGPVASFVLSIPICVLGLMWSRAVQVPTGEPPGVFAVMFAGQPIWLGGSLLFDALAAVFAPGADLIILHPLAFAGWLGLFVTALNMFPLAQLDGGHILYALLGRAQRIAGLAFLGVLLALGTVWWGWWLWAAVILFLSRGTVRHPSVLDTDFPVPAASAAVGWICVLIFIVTFVTIPIRV